MLVQRAPKLPIPPDEVRDTGIDIIGGPGSGKTHLMGQFIIPSDWLRGIPTIVLDPTGTLTDNVLQRLLKYGEYLAEHDDARYEQFKKQWKQIRYVDMSGRGKYITPFPLYYRLSPDESHYDISQRYLDVLWRFDKHLREAPMKGWNALWPIGTAAGIILSALGLQITDIPKLLQQPEKWMAHLTAAAARDTAVAQAISFFKEEYQTYMRAGETQSFRHKFVRFLFDPGARHMFGGAQPGIDWQTVITNQQLILLDFRHEHNREQRRFKLLWVLYFFLNFILHRGPGQTHPRISLIIDELSQLSEPTAAEHDPFEEDLNELFNVVARNHSLWVTVAHQGLWQFSQGMQRTLRGIGTHIVGRINDQDEALLLARNLFRIDPTEVMRYRNIWGSEDIPLSSLSRLTRREFFVIDTEPVELPLEAQHYRNSYQLRDLTPLHFYVQLANSSEAQLVAITEGKNERWVDEARIAAIREKLLERDGIPVAQVQSAVDTMQPLFAQPAVNNAQTTPPATQQAKPPSQAPPQKSTPDTQQPQPNVTRQPPKPKRKP